MRLTIPRSTLLPALARIQAVARGAMGNPILTHALLVADGDTLTVTGTDMELAVKIQLPCVVAAPGRCTAPAEMLRSIVDKLPADASIEISHDGERVAIKAGRSTARLSSLDVAEFPAIEGGAMSHSFVVPGPGLARLIGRCRWAMSKEVTRLYMCGLYLCVADQSLRAAAMDGNVLARSDELLPDGAGGMTGIIIPPLVLNELFRALSDDPVAVSVSETRVSFTVDGMIFISKLIDGTFPEYERVTPRANPNILTVDKAAFLAAVDLVSSVSDVVRIELSGGEIVMTSTDPNAGEARAELGQGVVDYSGDDLTFGAQLKYLRSVLSLCGDRMELALRDPAAPILARDPAAPESVYVVMPYKV